MRKKVQILITLFLSIVFAATVLYLLVGRPAHKYRDIVNKAIEQNDLSICNEIDFFIEYADDYLTIDETRYLCGSDFAIKTEDIDLCKSLDEEPDLDEITNARNHCLTELASNLKMPDLCNELRYDKYISESAINDCKENAQ